MKSLQYLLLLILASLCMTGCSIISEAPQPDNGSGSITGGSVIPNTVAVTTKKLESALSTITSDTIYLYKSNNTHELFKTTTLNNTGGFSFDSLPYNTYTIMTNNQAHGAIYRNITITNNEPNYYIDTLTTYTVTFKPINTSSDSFNSVYYFHKKIDLSNGKYMYPYINVPLENARNKQTLFTVDKSGNAQEYSINTEQTYITIGAPIKTSLSYDPSFPGPKHTQKDLIFNSKIESPAIAQRIDNNARLIAAYYQSLEIGIDQYYYNQLIDSSLYLMIRNDLENIMITDSIGRSIMLNYQYQIFDNFTTEHCLFYLDRKLNGEVLSIDETLDKSGLRSLFGETEWYIDTIISNEFNALEVYARPTTPLVFKKVKSFVEGSTKLSRTSIENLSLKAGDGDRITITSLLQQNSLQRTYTFTKAAGDCPSGCTIFHSWEISVTNQGSITLIKESGDPIETVLSQSDLHGDYTPGHSFYFNRVIIPNQDTLPCQTPKECKERYGDKIPIDPIPFLSHEDIVTYDTDTHILQLNESLNNYNDNSMFVLSVDGQQYYGGYIASSISSVSRNDITLFLDGTLGDTSLAPFVEILKNYPFDSTINSQTDPRNNPEIFKSPSILHKLK